VDTSLAEAGIAARPAAVTATLIAAAMNPRETLVVFMERPLLVVIDMATYLTRRLMDEADEPPTVGEPE
jgi:hypothetical protein